MRNRNTFHFSRAGRSASALVVLTVGALVAGCTSGTGGDDAERLEATAPELEGSPAIQYTGSLDGPDGDGPAGEGPVEVDIEVTNTGEAMGTLTAPDGEEFDYLAMDGDEFVWSESGSWGSLGIEVEDPGMYEGMPLMLPADALGLNLSDVLAPPAVAARIEEALSNGDASVGDTVDVDGRSAVPVTVEDATYYLAEDDSDGLSLLRIEFGEAAAFGAGVFLLLPIARERGEKFYYDFREKLETVENAADPKIHVATKELRNPNVCSPTACTFVLRVTITYLGSASNADGAAIVEYTFDVTRDGVQVDSSGCAGSVTIGYNKSADLTCNATAPNPPAGNRTFEFLADPHLTVIVLDEEEYRDYLQKEADNREKVFAMYD
ncbi:hypothetical protein [Salininema proteolyticum]|uniref:DUF4352 domain-containing protein n=1 Tax=Salininema proteolyticum TaxID=1607685 RepID=A0ABV8TWT2_9ACTN